MPILVAPDPTTFGRNVDINTASRIIFPSYSHFYISFPLDEPNANLDVIENLHLKRSTCVSRDISVILVPAVFARMDGWMLRPEILTISINGA